MVTIQNIAASPQRKFIKEEDLSIMQTLRIKEKSVLLEKGHKKNYLKKTRVR